MKYGVIGDLHFGVRNGNKEFLDFQIAWLWKSMRQMKAQGISIAIQVGDMFDNRKSVDALVGQTVDREVTNMLEELDMTMIILVGNHNIYYRDHNDVTNMWFFEKNPRIKLVHESSEIQHPGGPKMLMLGWINKNNYEAMTKAVAVSDAEYCFGHLEFEGFPMYKGVLATHGMSPVMFKKFKKVVTGHYHTISQDGNVFYTGSPYHLTWSDYPDGLERGWFLLDTVSGEYSLQRNGPKDTLFHIFEYDHNKKVEDQDLSPLIGKIGRVVVHDTSDTKKYNKFLAALRELKVIECKVVDKTIIDEKNKEQVAVDTSKIVGGNIMNTIVSYAVDLAKTVQGADESIVKSMTVELYNGASN
jgi:metallophosphoesterase superfamily enzyme